MAVVGGSTDGNGSPASVVLDLPYSRSGEASGIRRASLFAVASLAVLNVADVATTHRLVARGGVETNPLASTLLTSSDLLLVKLVIIGLLGLAVLVARPRLGVLGGTWFAAGIYAASVLSNLLLLKVL